MQLIQKNNIRLYVTMLDHLPNSKNQIIKEIAIKAVTFF